MILDLSIEAVGAERGVLMTQEAEGELVVRSAKGNAFRISTAVRDRVLNTHDSVLVRDTMLDAVGAGELANRPQHGPESGAFHQAVELA